MILAIAIVELAMAAVVQRFADVAVEEVLAGGGEAASLQATRGALKTP